MSFLTLLALSRRSGKLLISGGNGRFDVVFRCGLAAEPVQRDKHAHTACRLLFKHQRVIQDSFFFKIIATFKFTFRTFRLSFSYLKYYVIPPVQ